MTAQHNTSGTLSITAPSNIAFVKYWGKTGRQYPINPSVSMTLQKCVTVCELDYRYGENDFSLDTYMFEGEIHNAFRARFETYFQGIKDVCPIVGKLKLAIRSHNSFPHSAGIASSASAFASLGAALAHLEERFEEKDARQAMGFAQRASYLARLGSGSAARSITGPYTIWGECADVTGTTHDYAVPVQGIAEEFKTLRDCVLLIDTGEKKVSSSAGHALMEGHVYRDARIKQVYANTTDILNAMRAGDFDLFGRVVENEALSLHALMMTSQPSYILLADKSLQAIKRIQDFRNAENIPVYFTIDAGPNIHVLYPESAAARVEQFVKDALAPLCVDNQYILDQAGSGVDAQWG